MENTDNVIQVDEQKPEQEKMSATWFQEQINEVAKSLSESAVTQLSLKVPTLDIRLLQYFKQERAVHIAASLLTNRMLQYMLENLHALMNPTGLEYTNPYQTRSMIGESGKIELSNLLSNEERGNVVTEILNVLQMELSQITQKQQQAQAQQNKSQVQSSDGGFIL